MNLNEIIYAVNQGAYEHKIGRLHKKRLELGKKTKAYKSIFQRTDKDWAGHWGSRGNAEIQFNMGYDLTHFRYGLAFSIEPSKTLPNPIQALTPKIKKFNCLINERPELFEGYKMWYWRGGKHVDCGNVCAILPSNGMNITNNTFIFFGKLVDVDKTSVEDILSTFDSMLEIYCIIENDDKQVIASVELAQSIRGGIGTIKRPSAVQYTNEEKLISVSYIHASIQEKLGADLKIQFGEENVKFECLTPFGKKVDIYVTDQNKKILYEVKIASSLEDCMRQAIGQLLEYGFWDGDKQADKLVIVGEYRQLEPV